MLAQNDSSTIAQALEDISPHTSWEAVKALVAEGKFRLVVLSHNADLDAANTRVKNMWADRVITSNRVTLSIPDGTLIIYLHEPCWSHIINTVLSSTFDRKTFVPKLHAICYTLGDLKRFDAILGAFESLCVSDLAHGFVRGRPPPPGHLERSTQTMSYTLLRQYHAKSRDNDNALHAQTSYWVRLALSILASAIAATEGTRRC
jgi:hypothetical protein